VHTLQIMREKALELLPKSIIMHENIINNSRKTWCKMDVSAPPSLDLACPQAKTKIKQSCRHALRERGVDKNKIQT
jgi:hypothetical protein